MHARTASAVSIWGIVFLGLCAAADLVPPPPGPVGWEQEITPGFEPSIESAVINRSYDFDNKSPEIAKQWGPGAFPVLVKLYEDPRWRAFRGTIVRFMVYADPQEADRYFADAFDRLMAAPPEQREKSDLSKALAFGGAPPGPKIVKAARDHFKRIAGKPECTQQDQQDLGIIAGVLATSQSDEDNQLLVEFARQGSEFVRCTSICWLTPHKYEQAKALSEPFLAEAQDPKLKDRVVKALESSAPSARAAEPMSRILELEAKGAHK